MPERFRHGDKKSILTRRWPAAILVLPVLACFLLAACQLPNYKWTRVRKDRSADVARSRLNLKSFFGPKEKVENFFNAYRQKDWKTMESMMSAYSDLRFVKDRVEEDFRAYVEIVPLVWTEEPVYNEEQDRVRIQVQFAVEKIQMNSGSLSRREGRGAFILTRKGGWDIVGYVGDPFWGVADK